jgi:heme-binding protein
VAGDLTSIAQPLTNMSTQCKLPITIPQAMGLMQQAQGAAGGLPGGLPGGVPGSAAGTPPAAPAPVPTGGAPGAVLPGVTVGGAPNQSGPVAAPRQNNVG